MDKEDVKHIYNRILFSHENESNNSICSNMDGLEIIILSQAKTNIIWYHLYVESKKKSTNELLFRTKQKQTHSYRKQTYNYQKGMGGGINWKFRITRCTLLYKINSKDFLYNTGSNIPYLIMTYNGKYSEKNIYVTESFCCIPETNIML